MQGTVRTVVEIADNDAIDGNEGYLVAVRWDDGTLDETFYEVAPAVDDRVMRDE